jgi:3D-(3,5/4)-trihydroxycyclohexane-1,2-dione acylhydrolase (decyclizing)
MKTVRLTMAQALIRFLKVQFVQRDGLEHRFFGGCFGIFGHGNVAGIGQALQQNPDFPFVPFRNEQAQVHAAVAYARMRNRLGAMVCTSSIGPGATNMLTGAAMATINRLPVLLLPGDVFARRNVAPVLQQLESDSTQDISVNDCFRPVSRYWDRIERPEQLLTALPEVMRVLTSPAQTGAVTLSLPQDVQTEAWDFPVGLFRRRVWHVPRNRADPSALDRAAAMIRSARRPLIVAGGGVQYSDANDALSRLCRDTGIPVGETQAGKGSLRFDHPCCLGGIGATGSMAANLAARDADVVIGIGTRYSDFTTASKTQFRAPDVRFININVTEFDAFKHDAIALVGDARAAIEELAVRLAGWSVDVGYRQDCDRARQAWDIEVGRVVAAGGNAPMRQAEVIGVLNDFLGESGVVINAAGSAPGDLHKLWRTRDRRQYHVEYGYSTMGYEIPAGLGVKMAAPDRDVVALVGDGTFLMMPTELVTAVQEGLSMTVVLVDNHGFASIGGLSESLGSGGFGTLMRRRAPDGTLAGDLLPLDFVAMARAMGVHGTSAGDCEALRRELVAARTRKGSTVIVVECDREQRVGGCESWWDVAVAEVSDMDAVRCVRETYESAVQDERDFFSEGAD